jgi:hypothetical protein
VSIVGVGAQPEEVTIVARAEDSLRIAHDQVYGRHLAILAIAPLLARPVTLENLTLRVTPPVGTLTLERAIMTERADLAARHSVRRLRLETQGATGVEEALYLADGIDVQDVLITGAFETCARFGLYDSNGSPNTVPLPPTSNAIVNTTCRLLPGGVRAGFEVGSVTNGRFVNLAIELADGAPLFAAHARPQAGPLELPVSFAAYACSAVNFSMAFGGFTMTDGTYDLNGLEAVLAGAPFFASATDAHLQSGTTGIDSGIDPAVLVPGFTSGTALDGTPRTGRVLDRGAYEQGQ